MPTTLGTATMPVGGAGVEVGRRGAGVQVGGGVGVEASGVSVAMGLVSAVGVSVASVDSGLGVAAGEVVAVGVDVAGSASAAPGRPDGPFVKAPRADAEGGVMLGRPGMLRRA